MIWTLKSMVKRIFEIISQYICILCFLFSLPTFILLIQSQYYVEPPWPRGSVLGLRPSGLEFQILCLEDSAIWIISPSSRGSPGPFRRVELIVHITISVLHGTYLQLSQEKHVRVKCLSQGHNHRNNVATWRGRNMISHIFSRTLVPSGIRTHTASSANNVKRDALTTAQRPSLGHRHTTICINQLWILRDHITFQAQRFKKYSKGWQW